MFAKFNSFISDRLPSKVLSNPTLGSFDHFLLIFCRVTKLLYCTRTVPEMTKCVAVL